MKCSVKGSPGSLSISVEQIGDSQQKVLESLQACAEGRCSCPTTQYGKLDSIRISPGPDGISIEMKARQGEMIDESAIEECLAYTAQQASGSWYRFSGEKSPCPRSAGTPAYPVGSLGCMPAKA